MPKLSFIYGPMNCGKTTKMLMTAYNYESSGRTPLILKPTTDVRNGVFKHMEWGPANSRLVKECPPALYLDPGKWEESKDTICNINPDVVLVDEVQFLYTKDIWFLSDIVDGLLGIAAKPVLCYGLKTTAEGNLFEGSAALLAMMDEPEETRGVCACGRRATMHIRLSGGKNLVGAAGVESEGVKYLSVCRKCFKEFERKRNG